MKLAKRITSLLLSLVLLVSLACTGAWVPHVHAESETVALDDLQIIHVNPLYADTVSQDDLVKPERPDLYADNTDGTYYYDAESAGELIRDDLVARDTTIVVDAYCPLTSTDTMNQDVENLVYGILDAAMVHTGNPAEGDYLLWQYTGFDAKLTNAQHDGTNIYATITYTMTYHSSAAQEAEVDAAVETLLAQMNVSGAGSYEKLDAIYDYITSNVTYDHANLNDNSYKLKHTAYAALINKTAVCQGYALLLYRLALELGVDCRLIAGTGNGDNHGWNIAKVEDRYYNLDATWDAGASEYQYFLVSAKNFPGHTRWAEYDTAAFHAAYPMAEYNYTIDCKHTYESNVTTNPTCTDKGVKTYICSKCGDSYTEIVPATGHNYDKSVVTPPTCTEKGYTTHTCSACGDSYQDTLVASTGHSYDDGVVTKAATCTDVGIKTFTCADCKDAYTEELPKLEHSYDKTVVTPPTCTEQGYTTHTCSACGDSYQDTQVNATGHSYDDGVVTKAATCTEEGVKTFTCTVCKTTFTEAITVLPHAYEKSVVTDPTCTEKGYTTHTCSACGDSYQDSFVDATGHNYNNPTVVQEATCTEDGTKAYTCTKCSNTIKEAIPALGHAFDDGKVTTEATCTGYGTLIYTCARCESVINAYVDPLGHAYDEGTITTQPTCTEEGIKTYPCIRGCGNTTTEPVAPIGHVYEGGTVTTEPTCTEEGIKTIPCIHGCGSSITEPVPPTDHDFTTGTCRCGAKAVVITAEPKTGYAQMGKVAKATVVAEGEGLKYQWYIRNANQNKFSKSACTGDTYSCRMNEKSKNRRALCIITDQYGNKVQSKTIVIREAVSIVTEPKHTMAKFGEQVNVTVEASGDGLTYQWYFRNADQSEYHKASVTDATYTCQMRDLSNNRRLLCIVKDKYGKTVQSETVVIRMAATITAQPQRVTAIKGEVAEATVKAAGTDLTYQWYIKNVGSEKFVKSSITDATYTVTMSEKVDGREAYCVVTDKYGKTARSSIITFTMQ